MKTEELKDKSILILGFGREGQDTFVFLRKKFPGKQIGIADQNIKVPNIVQINDKKIVWHVGKDYLKAIEKYDIIIKTPGIPPKIVSPLLKKNQTITSQTQLFFDNTKAKIIGVTGTKGKSSTSSLIFKILKEGGYNVALVGNIEKPVLSLLSQRKQFEWFVYELSSHQLYGMRISPHISVFLNVYREHLDYYESFKEYYEAKGNIAEYQTGKDYLIYNSEDKIVSRIASRSKARKIPISGSFYDLNRQAAQAVGILLTIPKAKIAKSIENFKSLPYRLEFTGRFNGIWFYNDALATIPEATIGAIGYLGGNIETIMLGGYDRDLKFDALAKVILQSKIKNLILFPTTGKKIWQSIMKFKMGDRELNSFFTDSMEEAVKYAYASTSPGKICLLSNASASFNLFKDYREKGDQFKKYVRLYGQKNI